MSKTFPMAGFEVTLYGRFWVTPEVGVMGKFLDELRSLEVRMQHRLMAPVIATDS